MTTKNHNETDCFLDAIIDFDLAKFVQKMTPLLFYYQQVVAIHDDLKRRVAAMESEILAAIVLLDEYTGERIMTPGEDYKACESDWQKFNAQRCKALRAQVPEAANMPYGACVTWPAECDVKYAKTKLIEAFGDFCGLDSKAILRNCKITKRAIDLIVRCCKTEKEKNEPGTC